LEVYNVFCPAKINEEDPAMEEIEQKSADEPGRIGHIQKQSETLQSLGVH